MTRNWLNEGIILPYEPLDPPDVKDHLKYVLDNMSRDDPTPGELLDRLPAIIRETYDYDYEQRAVYRFALHLCFKPIGTAQPKAHLNATKEETWDYVSKLVDLMDECHHDRVHATRDEMDLAVHATQRLHMYCLLVGERMNACHAWLYPDANCANGV